MHFEGLSGAVSVSVVAFSIVFGVLLVLTGVIYGMKLFAAGKSPYASAVSHIGNAWETDFRENRSISSFQRKG